MIDKIIVFKISKFQLILAFCDRENALFYCIIIDKQKRINAKVKLNLGIKCS